MNFDKNLSYMYIKLDLQSVLAIEAFIIIRLINLE